MNNEKRELVCEAHCKAKMSKEGFIEELKSRAVRSSEEKFFYEGQSKAYSYVLEKLINEVE